MVLSLLGITNSSEHSGSSTRQVSEEGLPARGPELAFDVNFRGPTVRQHPLPTAVLEFEERSCHGSAIRQRERDSHVGALPGAVSCDALVSRRFSPRPHEDIRRATPLQARADLAQRTVSIGCAGAHGVEAVNLLRGARLDGFHRGGGTGAREQTDREDRCVTHGSHSTRREPGQCDTSLPRLEAPHGFRKLNCPSQ